MCVCVHPVNTICTFVSVQEFPGKRATTVTIVHNFETAIDTSTSHNWLGLHAVTVLQFVRFLFSALTLFVGQRQIRNLACKKFALVNPRVSLLTDTAQLRVTVGKRPNVNKSNVCVCVCVCVCVSCRVHVTACRTLSRTSRPTQCCDRKCEHDLTRHVQRRCGANIATTLLSPVLHPQPISETGCL